MTSRSTRKSFFQLLNPWSFIKVSDWRRNWWKPPLLLLLWILVIILETICILAARFRIAFYYVLRIAPDIRQYVHHKLHPTFRYPIAKQGYGPQRLGRRPRRLTLEFPSDEEVKESVHLKVEESCKGADQTARRQRDRLRRKHEPSDDSKQQTEQRTFLQHQSILFCKMAPEIRLLVYRAVLLPPEGAELRIDRTHGRLCSYSHVYGEGTFLHRGKYTDELSSGSNAKTPQGHGNCKPNRSAGLLCSCRQVYMEAIKILYPETPFNIPHSTILQDLHETTVAHRFRSIRSLHLSIWSFEPSASISVPHDENPNWNTAWLTIGWMTGLRRLRVTFKQPMQDDPDVRLPSIRQCSGLVGALRPMLNFQIPDFEVRITWPTDTTRLIRRLGGEVPFRIVVKEIK